MIIPILFSVVSKLEGRERISGNVLVLAARNQTHAKSLILDVGYYGDALLFTSRMEIKSDLLRVYV
jgi:hypothetical protein